MDAVTHTLDRASSELASRDLFPDPSRLRFVLAWVWAHVHLHVGGVSELSLVIIDRRGHLRWLQEGGRGG